MLGLKIEIAYRNEAAQRPIADEQRGADDNHAAQPKGAKDNAGEKISQGDALQHTHPADMFDALGEAVVKNAKNQARIAAGDEHVRRGPDFLDHGKLESP